MDNQRFNSYYFDNLNSLPTVADNFADEMGFTEAAHVRILDNARKTFTGAFTGTGSQREFNIVYKNKGIEPYWSFETPLYTHSQPINVGEIASLSIVGPQRVGVSVSHVGYNGATGTFPVPTVATTYISRIGGRDVPSAITGGQEDQYVFEIDLPANGTQYENAALMAREFSEKVMWRNVNERRYRMRVITSGTQAALGTNNITQIKVRENLDLITITCSDTPNIGGIVANDLIVINDDNATGQYVNSAPNSKSDTYKVVSVTTTGNTVTLKIDRKYASLTKNITAVTGIRRVASAGVAAANAGVSLVGYNPELMMDYISMQNQPFPRYQLFLYPESTLLFEGDKRDALTTDENTARPSNGTPQALWKYWRDSDHNTGYSDHYAHPQFPLPAPIEIFSNDLYTAFSIEVRKDKFKMGAAGALSGTGPEFQTTHTIFVKDGGTARGAGTFSKFLIDMFDTLLTLNPNIHFVDNK